MSYALLNNNKQQNCWSKRGLYILAVIAFLSLGVLSCCWKHLEKCSFIIRESPTDYISLDNALLFFKSHERKRIKESTPENFVVCYYTLGWDSNSTWNLQPHQIDVHICTHLIVGFASINNNCSLDLGSGSQIYKSVAALKHENAKLKIMLSVGGGGGVTMFQQMTENHAKRKVFIKSVLNTLKSYNFDGFDVDWEFPSWLTAANREKIHFVQLLQELRRAFDRSGMKLLLSAAVGAPSAIVDQCYNVPQIAEHIDFVNLMTYDYHFYISYYPVTGLNAPLFSSSSDPLFASFNVNFSANYWVSMGMPREKIVVGIPTYGHSYALYNRQNHDLRAPAKGFGKLGDEGYISYSSTCQFLKSGATKVFVNESRVPYVYKGNEWISYDDVTSVALKTNWIKEQRFKGAMIFSLNTDNWSGTCLVNMTFPLTRTISRILLNN